MHDVNEPAVITTERLRLRPMRSDDAAFVLELLNQPAFLQYVGDRGLRTVEDAERYLEERVLSAYVQHGFGQMLVERIDDGRSVGVCGLIRRPNLEDVDIGFAFLPEFWSHGYAYEAARATLDHGRRHLGLARIIAIVSPENARSIRLLERLGMHMEGTMTWPDGGETLAVYA